MRRQLKRVWREHVAYPSKRAVETMLTHLGLTDYREIPLRSTDVPATYLRGERASWLIHITAGQ